MGDYEQYVIECIKQKRQPSNRKLASLRREVNGNVLSIGQLYATANKMEIPLCCVCGLERVQLISVNKGFRKYCSTECYKSAMSRRNTDTNADLNRQKKETKRQLYAQQIEDAAERYINGSEDIKAIEKELNLPQGRLRKYLAEHNLVDRQRRKRSYNANLMKRLEKAYNYLNDPEWVHEKISEGWTSRMFAEYLKCSANFVCEKLRERGISLADFNRGSSYEKQICQLLDRLGVEYVRNNRSVLQGKELDIYIDSHKIAIEVNGVYWHKDDSERHLDKTRICESKNVRLLHFTDKEIDSSYEKTASIITAAVGQSKIIYARDCYIESIDSQTMARFANENHLQGHINSSIRFGLFYRGDLVSVMGFAKPRFNKSYQYELTRFCNKLFYSVVGGASKLFMHFIRTYNPESVISYCQRRLYTGGVYQKMGMVLSHDTPPNYVWVHNYRAGDVKTRYQTQRHMLNISSDDMSEREYMEQQGYMKIYDCGQLVYSYERDQ